MQSIWLISGGTVIQTLSVRKALALNLYAVLTQATPPWCSPFSSPWVTVNPVNTLSYSGWLTPPISEWIPNIPKIRIPGQMYKSSQELALPSPLLPSSATWCPKHHAFIVLKYPQLCACLASLMGFSFQNNTLPSVLD